VPCPSLEVERGMLSVRLPFAAVLKAITRRDARASGAVSRIQDADRDPIQAADQDRRRGKLLAAVDNPTLGQRLGLVST
jgi:hypothetical protein